MNAEKPTSADLPPKVTSIIERRFGDRPGLVAPMKAVAREIIEAAGAAPTPGVAPDASVPSGEVETLLKKSSAALGVLLKAPSIANTPAAGSLRALKREIEAMSARLGAGGLSAAPEAVPTTTEVPAPASAEPAEARLLTDPEAKALAGLLSALTARAITIDAPLPPGAALDLGSAHQRFAQTFGLSAPA